MISFEVNSRNRTSKASTAFDKVMARAGRGEQSRTIENPQTLKVIYAEQNLNRR